MSTLGTKFRRTAAVVALLLGSVTASGCELVAGFFEVQQAFSNFWEVAPFIPVGAYWSERIESGYWEEERYGKVPVLDPIEGENAPLFCRDAPSPDEVRRALPDTETGQGGFAFIAETQINNVRMVVEPIVDRVDECKFYPLVGPARLHHCHYKCTVYYDKTIRSDYPIPFQHTDEVEEVVYIDHDYLIRCAGPVVD